MSTASQTAHQAKDQAQSTFHKAEEKVSQQVNSLSDRYVAPVADYTKRSMRDKPVMSGEPCSLLSTRVLECRRLETGAPASVDLVLTLCSCTQDSS